MHERGKVQTRGIAKEGKNEEERREGANEKVQMGKCAV